MADSLPRLPRLPQRRDPLTDKVVAQQQDWGVQAPAPNSEMTGLVRGLSELNPALKNYENEALQAQHAALEKQKAGISALAQQQSDAIDMQGKRSIEFAGNPTPAQVPLALSPFYRDAFHKALGEREGIMSKDSTMSAYNEAKDKPGFNVDAFLGESRANALKGLEGVPVLAAQVGNQVNTAEVQIRQDAQRAALLKHTETRNATVAQSFADALRPDLPASAMFDAYTTKLLPQAEALGMSKKEGAQFLLNQLTNVSAKMGGNPAVFDIFDRKDAEGLSLASRNPELANNIIAARNHAQSQSDGKLKEDSQQRNFVTMTQLEQQMKADPASITLDVVRANMGKTSPFATHDEAFGFWMKAQKMLEDKQGTSALQANYDSKTMYLLDPKDQKKVMDANLGPYAKQMADAATKGDVATVTGLAENIMRAQSAVGAKEPLTAVEQFISTTVTSMPGKAPSPAFKAAAAIYRAYSSDPAFREVYFKGDVAEVMKAFVAGAGSGDEQAAYEGAYRAVSPEGKAAAAKIAESPEFKAKAEKLYKDVQGSSWWPQWLGGNGRPGNATGVSITAAGAVKDYYAKNPNASDKDLQSYAADWVAKNYVNDTSTSVAVRIPPEFAGQLTQEALSAFSKKAGDEFRARMSEADRADWKVNFLPTGDAGRFEVVMQNGSAIKHIGAKSLQDMRTEFRSEKSTSPEERVSLKSITDQLKSGNVDPAMLEANAPLLAKAKRLGIITSPEMAKLDKLRGDTMLERIRTIPLMNLGPADNSGLQFIPQRGAKVDNKLTAQTASGFMTQAVMSPGGMAQSLAGSLITMSEGTVLQAYPDPAKDAGNNIGMGYNLKANVNNATADLVRAGVPAERVEDVKNGKAQLTQDQARRLLLVAMPRYEDTARRSAEATQPGLWDRMQPHQKAVMTDIAYSVGSTDQFKKAWAAMASGDAAAFKDAVMTTYVNKDGVRVNDTRRFNLRAAMLSGTPNWNATVAKYGGFPSNELDSMALNKPQ
ncbi:hypothetical protein GNX71_18595 [Variovorax sp. RKNM96]|uniref:hypothetical protein n=1 Tax=Variovorax sp. RKNM96 TaxID=2681552 RepID=UPI00197E894F|nr:hypothetical protein [Variovorax sp. RKNM96]QSI31478.1 hypothetical protein GNX71_18595 [Variovorax sp. RKNM96]